MSFEQFRRRISWALPMLMGSACALMLIAGASSAYAADVGEGWRRWWLPPDRSAHGHGIDSLFLWTFWITTIVFVIVQVMLVVFLIKYRSRPERKKGYFTHGNTRLELAWTIAPAIILVGLAIANKGIWEGLRYNPDAERDDLAQVMVIGQQFKWNVVYPGPDGQFGRYLIFPRPTDTRWPGGIRFAGVPGPAFLPYARAMEAINRYIDQENPLGKDFDDPLGKDDDWVKSPGRVIFIPANRPVKVILGSKDVIHSFFLPNHRVKLDAVPGMAPSIVFTATMTSREREEATLKTYSIEELEKMLQADPRLDLRIRVTAETKNAVLDARRNEYLIARDPQAARPATIIRDGGFLTQLNLDRLKEVGVSEVLTYVPGHWEIVCEELCGQGHYEMRGELYVLDDEEFRRRFEGGAASTETAEADSTPAELSSAGQ